MHGRGSVMSSAQEGGCGIAFIGTVATPTQSKLLWVVLPTPAPGVWAADWLWQNLAVGYRGQTLMSHPHAALQGCAEVYNFLGPAAQAVLDHLETSPNYPQIYTALQACLWSDSKQACLRYSLASACSQRGTDLLQASDWSCQWRWE